MTSQAEQPPFWVKLLPFADAASDDLPLPRLLRLSLFQISVGLATVLLTGALNRVMIVELSVPAWLVALMVGLPLIVAPFRALIGHRSDTHRSAFGWRRAPFIWYGTMMQWGGLAIMPFALLVLSGDTVVEVPAILGQASAGLAFLLVGAGLHVTQTAGLALATDLAPKDTRPRVVALLYVMLLAGMGLSALVFGVLLADYTPMKLIRIIQGAAMVTLILNLVALWRQEARNPRLAKQTEPRRPFSEAWAEFAQGGRPMRLLVTVGLGAAGFNMQDVLLEPYGGEVLGLSVSATTQLTAFWAAGMLAGFAVAARGLGHGAQSCRIAAWGVLVGIFAFAAVILAGAMQSALVFRIGAAAIGLGGGLFAVGTLTAAMALSREGASGLALGAWGAVQATAAGVAIALGGAGRDIVSDLAMSGALGPALANVTVGYSAVYHVEIALLFIALIVIGPLARYSASGRSEEASPPAKFGLAEFPS